MEFNWTETIYFVLIALFGAVGGLCRELRDQSRSSCRRFIGRVLSAGLWAFGCVGIWVGNDPASVIAPMYLLGVAAFVGFFTLEVSAFFQSSIKSIIKGLLKRVGIEIEESESTKDR